MYRAAGRRLQGSVRAARPSETLGFSVQGRCGRTSASRQVLWACARLACVFTASLFGASATVQAFHRAWLAVSTPAWARAANRVFVCLFSQLSQFRGPN
mmetsp:Transcript_18469/g.69996  ORF Transcript_18469/g.69996 Transcript_18469/m.69996 type:complete len:99 (-) Transcript_18469:350-646(-)